MAIRAERVQQAAAAPLEVVYDGDCPLCIRSMARFRYFDWLGRIRFSPLQRRWATLSVSHPQLTREACEREMHVLLPDGSAQKGFFAFRAMLRSLPALWPLLMVFYAPGASWVGPRRPAVRAQRGWPSEPAPWGFLAMMKNESPHGNHNRFSTARYHQPRMRFGQEPTTLPRPYRTPSDTRLRNTFSTRK